MDYEKKYKEALERAEKILEFYKHPAYAEVYSYAKCVPYNEETKCLLSTYIEYNGKYKTW